MNNIYIDSLGLFLLPNEFKEFTGDISHIEVYPATTLPSEILYKLIEGKALLLTGEYRFADAVYRYCQRNENQLIKHEEILLQNYQHRQTVIKNIKRQKLHRLLFAARRDELSFITDAPHSEGLQRWYAENTKGQPYLIPIRRYQRILTDIRRAKEGIYFDFLKANITIHPFVYVPSDQSVPAMFMEYKSFFQGKHVLDLGTGTGILAIIAAEMNAKEVKATDINPNAVDCARENVRRLALKGIINVCDPGVLFEPVRNDVFDIILFNAPWIKGEPKSLYEYALYDPCYKVINSFLSEVSKYLDKNGFILLQYSDVSQRKGENSIDNLQASLERNGLQIAAQSSISRKSRVLGSMERVYLFKIINSEYKIKTDIEGCLK